MSPMVQLYRPTARKPAFPIWVYILGGVVLLNVALGIVYLLRRSATPKELHVTNCVRPVGGVFEHTIHFLAQPGSHGFVFYIGADIVRGTALSLDVRPADPKHQKVVLHTRVAPTFPLPLKVEVFSAQHDLIGSSTLAMQQLCDNAVTINKNHL